MSSSTITVKPQRGTARSPPPGAVKSENVPKGTILLRNPLPKYSFDSKLKKGVKKSSVKQNTDLPPNNKVENKNGAETGKRDDSSTPTTTALNSNIMLTEPTQIGRLVSSFPQSMATPELIKAETQSKIESGDKDVEKSDMDGDVADSASVQKEKPVNKVDPFSQNTPTKLTHSVSESSLSRQSVMRSSYSPSVESIMPPEIGSQTQHISNQNVSNLNNTQDDSLVSQNQSVTSLDVSGVTSDEFAETQSFQLVSGTRSSVCSCRERIQQLEEEKQLLKNQLEVQHQVNQELKKLLVASVGEDLHHRVERLMRDKALLSMEVGDYNKKISEDYEHLDKISIQADMWRSKYLACRVMADELASSKAYYTMQYQECQTVLQQLLNERHELRANLYETYRGLQQVQEAFDPLKSQISTPRLLTSKHVISLARTNQQLVDIIKYRLLPSHVTTSMNTKMEPDWHDYPTQAEAHAQELLSREMRPEDFRHLTVNQSSIVAAPGIMSVDRYHPCTNYDNLTLNVCCKCKGDISVV